MTLSRTAKHSPVRCGCKGHEQPDEFRDHWCGRRWYASYLGLGGDDTVVNSLTGHMAGRIDLGNGTNKLTNGGFIGADVSESVSLVAQEVIR